MGSRSSLSRATISPQPPPPDQPGRHQNLAITLVITLRTISSQLISRYRMIRRESAVAIELVVFRLVVHKLFLGQSNYISMKATEPRALILMECYLLYHRRSHTACSRRILVLRARLRRIDQFASAVII